jgi:hypothetical protein
MLLVSHFTLLMESCCFMGLLFCGVCRALFNVLIVVLPCILVSSKLFCQQMHSLLKHKMLQLTLKISFYMAPTCFGPFGPSSWSVRWNLAKVTVFVELSVKIHRQNCCCAVATCAVCTGYCAACDSHATQHPVNTLQTEAHIATAQQQFLTMYFY